MDELHTAAVIDLDPDAIDVSLSALRLVDPQAQARMLASVRRQGQLTPVVAGRAGEAVVLVDGFKRHRALQQLGSTRIRVQLIERPARALKAAMIQLNAHRGGLSSLEEAWVLESLQREDALSQEQIGVLLGRHKSWVCRRLALVGRLCEEAREHLRLGLISAMICRHLTALPRGNQPALLACVIKHRLSSRETAQLARRLRELPVREHGRLLWLPLEVLDARAGCPPPALTGAAAALARRLRTIQRRTQEAADSALAEESASWSAEVRRQLTEQIGPILALLTSLRNQLSISTDPQWEEF